MRNLLPVSILTLCLLLKSASATAADNPTATPTSVDPEYNATACHEKFAGDTATIGDICPALPIIGDPIKNSTATTGAVASGVVASDAGAAYQNGVNMGSYRGNKLKNHMLTIHNKDRKIHHAKPLKWNKQLATYAKKYTEKCVFEHSGGPHGENLAAGFASSMAAADAWYHEGVQYDYSNPGFSEATGHFTQMTWKGSHQVGCGATFCNGKGGVPGWFMACEYNPPGNVIGRFKANVKKA